MSFMDVTANSLADLIELVPDCAIMSRKRAVRFPRGLWLSWRRDLPLPATITGRALRLTCKVENRTRNISRRAAEAGVKVCVFNAPEILTNSSSIFQGVEVALYPLLGAFRKEAPDHPVTRKLLAELPTLKPELRSMHRSSSPTATSARISFSARPNSTNGRSTTVPSRWA